MFLEDVPQEKFTCPEDKLALISPVNELASFKLRFGDKDHNLLLPLGRYPYIINSTDQMCNVTLIAEG